MPVVYVLVEVMQCRVQRRHSNVPLELALSGPKPLPPVSLAIRKFRRHQARYPNRILGAAGGVSHTGEYELSQAVKEDFTVEQVKTVLDRYQYDIELYIHIYIYMNIIFVCLFSIG